MESRLRFLEHVEEHRHAETSERIGEPREQHHRRSQSPQHIKDGRDERPQQKDGCQNRSDQCQQCSILNGRILPLVFATLATLLQQFSDNARPSSLMTGPDAHPSVSVKVLVKEN